MALPFSPTAFLRRSWALALVAVMVWANWQAPEMHHFVRPAATAIWQLAPLGSSAAAQALQARLAAEPGVAACAVSLRSGCVAFVYHPDEVTPAALYQAVGRQGAQVLLNSPVTPPAARAAIRECPVPPGFARLLDQVRFALNLRRFFVSV